MGLRLTANRNTQSIKDPKMRMNRKVVTWIGSWMFSGFSLVREGVGSSSLGNTFNGIEFVVGEEDISAGCGGSA